MKVRIIKKDTIPAFGGYAIGSLKDGNPIIVLNINNILACSLEENISSKDVIFSTLVHEFAHLFQEYLDKDFDESEVEKLVDEYIGGKND